MDKVRLGMVGARFAAHLHLNNYEKLRGPKLEIVGIASQNEKSAAQTAKGIQDSLGLRRLSQDA